jgi:hypothetical protein
MFDVTVFQLLLSGEVSFKLHDQIRFRFDFTPIRLLYILLHELFFLDYDILQWHPHVKRQVSERNAPPGVDVWRWRVAWIYPVHVNGCPTPAFLVIVAIH